MTAARQRESAPMRTLDDFHDAEDGDPFVDDFGYELECTHCGGEGTCDANADPLWDCDDSLHRCHACNGSGNRRDQRVF